MYGTSAMYAQTGLDGGNYARYPEIIFQVSGEFGGKESGWDHQLA